MKKILVHTLALALCLQLAACGSNGGSGGDQSVSSGTVNSDVVNAASVGSDSCKVCHSLAHTETITGLAGQSSTNALAITHDCEACHGGGQFHQGMGPIAYPAPDASRCVVCHDDQVTKVLSSKHNAEDAENVAMLADGHDTGKCQRCHTTEGSRAFADVIGNKDAYAVIGTTVAALDNLDADGNAVLHNVTCAACHEPVTGAMHEVAGFDPNGNGAADQYDLCTSCHLHQNGSVVYGDGIAAGADGILGTADDVATTGVPTEKFYHNTAWYRVIASTHYDNPATTGVIEGYAIRKDSDSPCFDCHGHELHTNTRYAGTTQADKNPEQTIHTAWAQSAHAGGLLSAKYAVARDADGVNLSATDTLVADVMAAGAVDAAIGNAWVHYDWDAANRQSCQKCHTATGAAAFMTDPATYDATTNDFSHLEGWSNVGGVITSSGQNEVLYCWGCHTNAEKGELRTPGAISLSFSNGATAEYDEVSSSTVCVTCHSGRENGDSIKLDADADGVRSFINPHYLTAAGTVFAKSGYEYDGKNYANVSYFKHDTIGLSAEGTGTAGPCVACHMSGEASHSYEVVEKEAGVITKVNASVCATCHTGAHGAALVSEGTTEELAAAADFLQVEAVEYEETIEVLMAALASKGIHYAPSYPYFFNGAGGTGGSFTNWAGLYGFDAWKNVMGAAFNANLLHHEPGAYAHNRYYTKALIWDSIDFIDDGALNDSVVATIQALETAGNIDAALSAAAQAYLGTSRPGDSARPAMP